MPAETKTIAANGFTVTAVRKNVDGGKVIIIRTTYSDGTTEEHEVPANKSVVVA